ncbi:MAG: BBP7 family outer membrane beta-barrel protein [Planctomycetes bacterium]|nr:BBP7 family outer membrane beta-barrel protein [Planctomycetota bacterium]
MWLVAGLLLSTTSTAARGQVNEWVNTPAHDLQFYSPVDFDFDNRPIGRESGYFFRYDKLSWAFTGEHVTVGDNSLVVQSEVIFRQNPQDQGTAPASYQIINGLQEVPPDAEFAWGERYEMGYFDGGSGWLVGILDGPEVTSQATYGFGTALLGEVNTDTPELTAVTGSAGFGSVHVNFATPPDFLLGFRDYHINGAGNVQSPTLNGPGPRIIELIIVNNFTLVSGGFVDPVTGEFFSFTSILNDPGIDFVLSKIQDGDVDDLDGDLGAGFVVITVGGNVVATFVDFDDLHRFNIRFDTFEVRNVTETQGIEIMRTHRLTNRHKMTKHQGNNLDIAYGVRFLRLRDSFFFEGNGGLLGRTFAETSAENQIVGPQIRAKWSRQRGRWNLGVDGRFLFGYNVQDLDQVGAIGELLIPGALNSSAIGQPTAFSYGRQENDFSPMAELRADLSYQVTSSITARLGYTGIFVDNITRASQMVRWALPDMGILEGSGKQEIFINGVNFGFDVVY